MSDETSPKDSGNDEGDVAPKTALVADAPKKEGKVLVDARTLMAVRDALVAEGTDAERVENAYLELYRAADPNFTSFTPWEPWELAAGMEPDANFKRAIASLASRSEPEGPPSQTSTSPGTGLDK
jgi:hypothetical protein